MTNKDNNLKKEGDIFTVTCPFCGRVFKSLHENQVLNNLNIHLVTQHQPHKEGGNK